MANSPSRPLAGRTAELSSISSALEELTRRVTAFADDAAAAPEDPFARDLYEVERALRSAHRRLTKLTG